MMGDPYGSLTNAVTSHRTIIWLSVVLAALAVAWACGDDSPAAPPQEPDPPRPTTVTVTPATVELTALGAIVQLTAEVRNQHAGVMARAAVTWESGNTSVATVGTSGLLTAVGNGSTEITATAGPANGQALERFHIAPDIPVATPCLVELEWRGFGRSQDPTPRCGGGFHPPTQILRDLSEVVHVDGVAGLG